MGRYKGIRYYIIDNIITGERFEGKGKEMAEIMGCTTACLYSYERSKQIYNDEWKVSCIDEDKISEDDELTEDILHEWDDFITAFRKKLFEGVLHESKRAKYKKENKAFISK